MFQNKRISKYVRPFLEKNLFCFKKKVYDLDHVVKEVTVVNGTIPNAEPKSDDKKPTETLDRFQSHSNGYINNSYIATTDDKLEKMQEPPTADPEDAGDTPFHGHIPSKYILQNFQILHLSIFNLIQITVIAPHIVEDEIDEPMSLWSIPTNASKVMVNLKS